MKNVYNVGIPYFVNQWKIGLLTDTDTEKCFIISTFNTLFQNKIAKKLSYFYLKCC